MNISVTKCEKRGVMPPVDKLGFGNYFTDHMFIMEYDEAAFSCLGHGTMWRA